MRINLMDQSEVIADTMTHDIAQMLDLDPELVGAVLNSMYLWMIQDVAKQLDTKTPEYSGMTRVKLHIPRVLDLNLRCNRDKGYVRYGKAVINQKFVRLVKQILLEGINPLEVELKNKATAIISDRYVKLLKEVLTDERYGFNVY